MQYCQFEIIEIILDNALATSLESTKHWKEEKKKLNESRNAIHFIYSGKNESLR